MRGHRLPTRCRTARSRPSPDTSPASPRVTERPGKAKQGRRRGLTWLRPRGRQRPGPPRSSRGGRRDPTAPPAPTLPQRGRLLQFLGGGNRRYYGEGGYSRFCGVGPAQGRGGTSPEGSRCQKGRGEVGLGKSEGKPVRCRLLGSQNQFVPSVGSLPARGKR